MVCDTPQSIVKFRGNRQWSYIDDSGPLVGEPDMDCILLNTSKPPFDNPMVRLAAAKALSTVQYAKIIDIGVDPPSNGVFVPGTPYYSKVSYPRYDPAGAAQLLRQVQAETGKPVSFVLGVTNGPSAVRGATYDQQKFENVGFKVTQAIFQQNDLIDNALQGQFQAYEWRQFGAVNPDMNYIFWSTTTVSDDNLSINMSRNSDPVIEASLQTGRTNPNASERAAAYQAINERFAVDLPYLWHDRAVWSVIANPTVQNFNNPTTPQGQAAFGMIGGSIWPTQIWIS
jgi:ABC-type transport system substrate-binding protein